MKKWFIGVFLLLALLAVVFSFMIPVARERGRRTSCIGRLRIIDVSILLFKDDHEGASPSNITDLIKYTGDYPTTFMCPSRLSRLNGERPKQISDLSASPEYSGYDYLSVISQGPENKQGIPVMCDKPGNHGTDGINIVFEDTLTVWWPGTIEEYAASNSLVITVNTNWLK